MSNLKLIPECELDRDFMRKMTEEFSGQVEAGKVRAAIIVWMGSNGLIQSSQCSKNISNLLGMLYMAMHGITAKERDRELAE